MFTTAHVDIIPGTIGTRPTAQLPLSFILDTTACSDQTSSQSWPRQP